MTTKKHKPEAFATKLRQVEVLVGRGITRVEAICEVGITEQMFCRWRKQHGGIWEPTNADLIELARQYGRYGHRRIAALLRDAGWQVNDKRVERL